MSNTLKQNTQEENNQMNIDINTKRKNYETPIDSPLENPQRKINLGSDRPTEQSKKDEIKLETVKTSRYSLGPSVSTSSSSSSSFSSPTFGRNFPMFNISKPKQKITGLLSNSASPTDTIITEYDTPQLVKVNDIFIYKNADFKKISIEPSSILGYPSYEKYYLQTLSYEFRFYNEIIQPILNFKISPHFVRYYEIVKNISLVDYIQLFNVTDNEGNKPINDLRQIIRNIFYMYYQQAKRPAITSSLSQSENDESQPIPFNSNMDMYKNYIYKYDWKNNNIIPKLDSSVLKNLKFNYITLQAIDNKYTKTFFNFCKKYIDKYYIPEVRIMFFICFFQIAQACYSLQLSHAVHNDLHFNNVWVTIKPNQKQYIKYIVENIEYDFYTNICCRLYDFDRSYAQILGNNPFLEPKHTKLCETANSCNDYNVNIKDFLQLLCFIIKILKNEYGEVNDNSSHSKSQFAHDILDTILLEDTPDNTEINQQLRYILRNSFSQKICLKIAVEGNLLNIDNKIFSSFNNYPTILNKIFLRIIEIQGKIHEKINENPSTYPSNTFVASTPEVREVFPTVMITKDQQTTSNIFITNSNDFTYLGRYIFNDCCN